MFYYILRRLAAAVPVLIGISIVVFVITRMIPGDAVDLMLGTDVNVGAERADELRQLFGLDDPLYIQYLNWISGVAVGNLGVSIRTGQEVTTEIANRLPVTLQLTVLSVVIGLIIAIPAGVVAAIRAGTPTEASMQVLGLLGLAIPNFWLGTLLILVTSRIFGWFPAASYVSFVEDPWRNLQVLILPAIALGSSMAAITMRMTRSSLLEILRREYINTARAKGLKERAVLSRHAIKNAMIPVITVVGIQTGQLLGGAIIIEQVFNLPGLGRLAITAISQRDYPLVQGVVLFTAVAFVVINLLVDILYAFIDPRIRYS